MKRYAAVVGRTPEFVRWSIRKKCRLRENMDFVSPEKTERLLRSPHEASVAKSEGRVCNGVALKSFVDGAGEKTIAGFFLEEVFAPFGGEFFVDRTCFICDANLDAPSRSTGCFGWLLNTEEISGLFEQWNDVEEMFVRTTPAWYGFWMNPTLEKEGLKTLLNSFEGYQFAHQNTSVIDSVARFVAAIERCVEHDLRLDVELFPSGDSDGLTWKIDSHCPLCKAPQPESAQYCRVCHRSGGCKPPVNRKVIGRRPYTELNRLLDETSATFLADWFKKLSNL
jgi:hypothetical protein